MLYEFPGTDGHRKSISLINAEFEMIKLSDIFEEVRDIGKHLSQMSALPPEERMLVHKKKEYTEDKTRPSMLNLSLGIF